jgi:signal transduction histidine kinase/CHASE2 domain-containing sensor protein
LTADENKNELRPSRRFPGAAKSFFIQVLLYALVCAFSLTGALEPLNLALMDMRAGILKRAPTDTLVVVEIDALSLRAEDRWPWSRERYATALANLQDAGAALVAFDVDFSSRSDPAGDAAFVKALARRPGEVILPVFSQWSTRSSADGDIQQTPPNAIFLQDAVIASVNLTAEKNGQVRRGWLGFNDGAEVRGSIAAVLAGVAVTRQETFYIDYGIDPQDIQRLSFHDAVTGAFPKDAVKGKRVMIGATALELGDEFVAPVYGVTPGVLFHALSYESLMQGRMLKRPQAFITLSLALVLLFWLCHKQRDLRWGAIARRHLIVLAALIGGPVALQAAVPVSFDSGPLLAAQFLSVIYAVAARLQHYARQVIRQRAATARYQALTGLVVRDNADGVIVADENGVVELCNERAKKLLGAPVFAGSRITDAAGDFPLLSEQGAAGDAVRVEYSPHRRKDLTLEIVAAASSHQRGGGAHADGEERSHLFVYTLRDISAHKRIETAEREAKEAAIAAGKMKTQLISNMSHELRTPLNGVIGFADILQKEVLGRHHIHEYREYSQNIYVSGKRLLGLVNDMLNVAKLDAGELEICKNPVSLSDVIDACLHNIETQSTPKMDRISIDVERDLPDPVIDASVVSEMLRQLVSNALKYTGEDALISIRAIRDGADLVVEVIDNGCGVDPQFLPKLTEAFFQADGALNRQHEGAGLGLYLVSEFAAIHGAILKLKSKQGVGFLARLRFPGAIAEHKASAAA